MKKIMIGLLLSLSLSSFACTSPTQIVAEDALKRGSIAKDKLVVDLSMLARQSFLDEAADDINEAVNEKDAHKAQDALLKYANMTEKVVKLLIQNERAKTLTRVGERFIMEQRGIVDIWLSEWDEAKKIQESKTTQPA